MRPITSVSWRLGWTSRLVLFFFLSILAGCGPGEGKVSGKVLFDGNPLPAGRVTFRPADPRMNSVSRELDEQGNFPEVVLPAGEVMVCIDNREWEPTPSLSVGPLPPGLPPEVKKAIGGSPEAAPPKPQESGSPRPSKRYVKIPERYFEVETSGLQFTVLRGEQTHNFELTK